MKNISKQTESEAWSFLSVPFYFSAASLATCALVLLIGHLVMTPEWVSYNLAVPGAMAFISLVTLFIAALVVVFASCRK